MTTEHQRKHLNFKKRALTLVFGDSIGNNVIAAMIQAEAIAQSREFGQVLYLNTFQTYEALDDCCAAAVHKEFTINTQELMSIESSTIGELANDQGMMSRCLSGYAPAKVIIINSWEFAARDCRLRERLLFRINEWITHYGASVIIYAEARNREVKIGKCQYGGLGKLTALASAVVNICGQPLERDPRYIEYEQRYEKHERAQQHKFWERQKKYIPVVEKDIEPAFRVSDSQSAQVHELERPEIASEAVHKTLELGLTVEEFLDRYSGSKSPSVHSQIIEKYERGNDVSGQRVPEYPNGLESETLLV